MVDRVRQSLSARFANMSFLCSCLVVFIHVGLTPESGTVTWWVAQMFTHNGVTRVAVPFFFLASGFFLSRHFLVEATWMLVWRVECAKRVRSLLLPYLIWDVTYGVFACVLAWLAFRLGCTVHLDIPLHPTCGQLVDLTGVNIFAAPALAHLWYLRCLMVFVILSPLFVFVARRMTASQLGVLFVSVGIVMSLAPQKWLGFLMYGLSIEGAFFFLAGMWLACRQPEFEKAVASILIGQRRLVPVCVGVACFAMRALFVYAGCGKCGYWVGWFGVGVLMFGLFLLMPTTVRRPWIVALSFPVYLIHQFVGLSLAGCMNALHLRDWIGTSSSLYFIRCFVVIALTIVLARGLRWFFPRFSCWAFGGR